LLLLIRDVPASRTAGKTHPLAMWHFYVREWRFTAVYSLCMGLIMTVMSGYVTWLPAALMRSNGIDEKTLGSFFAPVYLATGVTGTLSAGLIIMYRGGSDPVRAILRYMLGATLLLWPFVTFGLLLPGLWSQVAAVGASLLLISSVLSLSPLPFQHVTPSHLRAQAIGLLSMVAALFGTGLGPVLAGFLSDHLTFAKQPLSLALSLIGGVLIPVVSGMLIYLTRHHNRTRLDLSVK